MGVSETCVMLNSEILINDYLEMRLNWSAWRTKGS
jgi:hypothetical protein